ncbi:hypothetical protein BZG35_03560 [Brevundimonas sp. LM2]|uniref:hypothetical protein n=1 Tax=Brevundimonas sp. LM2 TaxID=1938605 RepID=UPI000983E860|nr:hypothetical protein [Brevundimonas sp. LM2]AQR60833.1 hypothetical protein BZG35_03560 [Brevundimonas sp. LM2]
MDIAAGLASLDMAIKIAGSLKNVEKAYDQVALKGQVIDLMGALYDAKGQLHEAAAALAERDREIARLVEAQKEKATLVEGRHGYLWKDKGDGVKIGYPVCPSCLDRENHQVELKRDGNARAAQCPRCDKKFAPVEYYSEPKLDGSQTTASDEAEAKSRADTALIHSQFRRLGKDLA